MPKVHHVKKARKAYKAEGIGKGDSYYWWKLRIGTPVRRSKTKPRRSQLTESEFFGVMWDAEDDLEMAVSAFRSDGDAAALASSCNDAASAVREAGEGCTGRRENMPEQLQDSEKGQLLEARAEQCELIADALESAASDIESAEEPAESGTPRVDAEDPHEAWIEEVASHAEGIEWDYE